ncbi:autophagy-related protein 13 [Sporobolomyces salmoneus]|uniref:autophagy-related protein 13 n=1 Tax=Sporobolomyces salmoneus TaxID=183962 RepID=UPI0031782CDA
MSWTQSYSSDSRPSSRSPPPPSTTSRQPLRSASRFNDPSPSIPYSQQQQHHYETAGGEAGGSAPRSEGLRRKTTSGSGEQQEQDTRDPATKQVDQIVQHFFSKTVAVISQTRTNQQSSNSSGEFQDPSSNSAAPSMRRGASTTGSSTGGKRKGEKINSWFNLTLPENEHFRTELKTWRNISSLLTPPSPSSSSFLSSHSQPTPIVPSLVLSVYLDASGLTSNQVLVLSDQKGRRTRVDRSLANQPDRSRSPPSASTIPRSRSRGGASTPGGGGGGGRNSQSPSSVVLERWNLSFQPTTPSPNPPSSQTSSISDLGKPSSKPTSTSTISLPSVYKHSILHFRSLYTLAKLLPTHSLARKLNRSSSNAPPTRGGGVKNGGNGGLRIGFRVDVREEGDLGMETREGEVEVEVPIESEENGRTTETVRFPGVETPLGTLHLTGTYRLNTDFGVEDIETLLSSRFIDEDFFRPTVNTARYRDKEESGKPGSLPISARAGTTTNQPRLGTSPSHQSPPITGLGPLPSYGSLSSRHQYAPQPTSSATSHPPPVPPVPPLPAPVPLHPAHSKEVSTESGQSLEGDRSPSVSSSSRLSAYGTSVPSRVGGGEAVEPAFISLSRARSGTNIVGIQRASPSPSLGHGGTGTSGIIRRTSLSGGGGGPSSSPSSGSPIFRPGSYLSNPSAGGAGGGGFPISSSPSFGPPSRQQSTFPPNATPTSQLTFGNRVSPLSPPMIPSGPSNLGATAPSRPIPLPSSSSPASGGVPIRGYSYSSTGGGGGGMGGVGSGSWSRSYGRGSSGSGGDSGGGGIESPGLARRASSRLSFGAGSSSIPRSSTISANYLPTTGSSSTSREEEKRFVNEGKPPQDAGDINDFLKLLDEKPDFGGLGNSRLAGSSAFGAGGSTVLRKKDVDEQLKMLRSSVFGFGGGAGGGGSSPSPPMPAFAISTASGTSSPRGDFGGISNLRRQTSRLSIEEEPAEYHQSPTRERKSPSEGDSENGLTPRPPYRQLRPDLVSPPLSTTSATSTVRQHQQQQQQPLRSDSPMRIGLEPRLYPLPSSSATSPLASPAILPPFSSVYPPLPYPPSKAKASTSTRTEPISFSPYISRAARLAQQDREGGGSGVGSERNSAAASVSSFSTQGDEVDAGSYREEEETVGRLELDDEERDELSERGRRYRAGGGEVDEEEISLSHSRDPTPAAAIRVGAGYFATRSHSRGGVGRNSPPDSYLA